MARLEGKSALITGAGRGIGRGIVERYIAEGANVVAIDRSAEDLALLEETHPGRVWGVAGDVRDPATYQRALAIIYHECGGLDVLVANAGITDAAKRFDDIDIQQLPDAFDELMQVNVLGVMLAIRSSIEHLQARQGSIIITCSFASFHASGGGVLYTASKHALVGVVKQLAHELAPNIRVNGVAPGVAPTQLTGISVLEQGLTDSVYEGTEQALPLKQLPAAQDFAGAYVFLADSKDSAHMTGSIITLDSGLSIRGISSARD